MNDELRERAKAYGETNRTMGGDGWQMMADFATECVRAERERIADALAGLFFNHAAVNHSGGEYVQGLVSTNSIESVWALLKRGITGVYHHVSPKHLDRYVAEFTFRLNFGNVKYHTLERLDSFVLASFNKRLTYKELTA